MMVFDDTAPIWTKVGYFVVRSLPFISILGGLVGGWVQATH